MVKEEILLTNKGVLELVRRGGRWRRSRVCVCDIWRAPAVLAGINPIASRHTGAIRVAAYRERPRRRTRQAPGRVCLSVVLIYERT